MIEGLGLSNKVDSGIEDMHQNQEAAQRKATFVNVDKDGNSVMMTRNAT